MALLYCIIPTNNTYWAGIGDSIREDAEAKISIHTDYVKKLTNGIPMLISGNAGKVMNFEG